MSKKSKKQFVYKHNDSGRFLQMSYIGDGEVYLDLVKDINRDCIIDDETINNWPLQEIIDCGSGGADVDDKWIDFETVDFTIQEVEVEIRLK
jgi:hypothetical protein